MNTRLIHVPLSEAIDGEYYISEMKHGWIEGWWCAEEQVCKGYYWHDMEWVPYALYRLEDEIEQI